MPSERLANRPPELVCWKNARKFEETISRRLSIRAQRGTRVVEAEKHTHHACFRSDDTRSLAHALALAFVSPPIGPLLVVALGSMVPLRGRVGRRSAVARRAVGNDGGALSGAAPLRIRGGQVVTVVLPTAVGSYDLH